MEVANCIFGEERRYVPYIFLNHQRIGGYGELYEMEQQGNLKSASAHINRQPTGGYGIG